MTKKITRIDNAIYSRELVNIETRLVSVQYQEVCGDHWWCFAAPPLLAISAEIVLTKKCDGDDNVTIVKFPKMEIFGKLKSGLRSDKNVLWCNAERNGLSLYPDIRTKIFRHLKENGLSIGEDLLDFLLYPLIKEAEATAEEALNPQKTERKEITLTEF